MFVLKLDIFPGGPIFLLEPPKKGSKNTFV